MTEFDHDFDRPIGVNAQVADDGTITWEKWQEPEAESCYRHPDRPATHQLHKPVGDPPELVPTVRICQEDYDELVSIDADQAAVQITPL